MYAMRYDLIMDNTKLTNAQIEIAIAHLQGVIRLLQTDKSEPAQVRMSALIEIQALTNVVIYLEQLKRSSI